MIYSTIDYALSYAAKGWRVFPCREKSKTPAVKWTEEATIDPEQIKKWWHNGSRYNIGIRCGAISGIYVLDVDPGKDGDASLFALISEYGALPTTPESLTGGGGQHYIFQHPGVEMGNTAGKLGSGLDTRGDGGYIVVPPSVHDTTGKNYEWELSCKPSETPVAPMPPWLLALLAGKKKDDPQMTETYGGTIQQGARNQQLTVMAGGMRRRGFDADAILAALIKHNQRHCQPPLADDEVGMIANSIGRYAPAMVRQDHHTQIVMREPLTAYEQAAQFIDLLANIEGRSVPTFIPPLDEATGGLERQTLTLLAARPSMGKSTLAWQIARNLASSGMKTLFFSLEVSVVSLWAKAACGALGLRWRDFRSGRASEQDKRRLVIKAMELRDVYGTNLLVDDGANTTDTMRQVCEKHRPDMVIVDHLQLSSDPGKDEILRLGQISSALKWIAKDMNLAALVLTQLSRGVEYRDDKRPHMRDLRESGHLEQNADNVIMMYRDDYYNPPEKGKSMPDFSETEILIRKFRDDIMHQRVMLAFDMKHQYFGALPTM